MTMREWVLFLGRFLMLVTILSVSGIAIVRSTSHYSANTTNNSSDNQTSGYTGASLPIPVSSGVTTKSQPSSEGKPMSNASQDNEPLQSTIVTMEDVRGLGYTDSRKIVRGSDGTLYTAFR